MLVAAEAFAANASGRGCVLIDRADSHFGAAGARPVRAAATHPAMLLNRTSLFTSPGA